ncbi:MAG: permease [Planctomycetota bacterium]
MAFLLLSLLPLALGPFLVAWAKRARWTAVWLDAFVIVTVGGMVLLHVLPDSLDRGGLLALAAFVVGLVAPVLAEQGLTPAGRGTRNVALVVALLALLFHSMLDGVWLHPGHAEHDHAQGYGEILVWAVLLHRLLEGIGIWWVVPRTLGVRVAIATSLVLVVGTLLGFSVGDAMLAHAPAKAIATFEALLCGSLAHIVVHAHIPPPRPAEGSGLHVASVLGGLAGGAVMWALTLGHSHGHVDAGDHVHGTGAVFLTLALQSAPALVFGYLAVGLSQTFLPSDWAGRIMGGRPLTQALRGVAVGLPLPVCSCGVLPIYRDLVRKGASLAGGLAFLVATPELEIAAILLSFRLLGPDVAIARVVSAGALALAVALITHRLGRPSAAPEGLADPQAPAAAPKRSFAEAVRYGFVDAVDDTGSWLLAGLGLAAIITPYLDPSVLRALPVGVDVPVAALLGLPLYVCASGSTPLAAVLVAQGISPGAAIAFLLTGPASNVTTYGVLARLHGHRLALGFAGSMLVLAVALGYGVNGLLGRPGPFLATDPHTHHGTVLEYACLTVLAGAFALFALRVGVRGMLARLFMAQGDDHGHGEHGAVQAAASSSCCHH